MSHVNNFLDSRFQENNRSKSDNLSDDKALQLLERELLVNSYPEWANIDDIAWTNAIRASRQIKASRGTTLMRGSAPMQQIMLLLSGSIRVYNPSKSGREITLYRVSPGDLCILSLNSFYQNKGDGVFAEAEAETDINALGINSQDFQIVLRESEKFRNIVLSTLNSHLCDLMCLIQETAFENLDIRLANLIAQLAKQGKTVRIDITHQALARELGTTREMISRILKEFEQRKIIKLSRGFMDILSPEGLQQLQQAK